MRERLKEIIGELRDLVKRAQDSLDDRPVLQAVLDKLREKVNEVDAEDHCRRVYSYEWFIRNWHRQFVD